jgi:hypothetical protein
MIKKVGTGLGIVLVALIVTIFFQPDQFAVSRQILVDASADRIFPYVDDFHHWTNWSPWEQMDPSMQRIYEGSSSGEGAVYSWSGNDQVGSGTMTITKSQAPNLIQIDLFFKMPMEARNFTEFTFQPDGIRTLVTWRMTGQNSFLGKAFHLFVDFDKMVGADFEKGLAQLKAISEANQ